MFLQTVILMSFISAHSLVCPIIAGANASVAPLHTGSRQEARRRDNMVNHVKLIVKPGVIAVVIDRSVYLDNRPQIVNLCRVRSVRRVNRFRRGKRGFQSVSN